MASILGRVLWLGHPSVPTMGLGLPMLVCLALGLALLPPTAKAQTVEFFDISEFRAASGPPIVFDFDSLPTQTGIVGMEFPGLIITHLDGGSMTLVDPRDLTPGLTVSADNVNTLPNGLSSSLFYSNPGTIGFSNSTRDAFRFILTTLSGAAGLWIGNIGAFDGDTSTPTTVRFLASDDGEIASETLTQDHAGRVGSGVNNRFFYGITTSSRSVSHIEVVNGPGDSDGILVDDLQVVSQLACIDMDSDGELDQTDLCPGTPLDEQVDDAGCSLSQFCGRVDATSGRGKNVCKKTDWTNDEPLMKKSDSDCTIDKGTNGPHDDRCVPR